MITLRGRLRTAAPGHRGTLTWRAWAAPLAGAAALTTAVAGTPASHGAAVTHQGTGRAAAVARVPRFYVYLSKQAGNGTGAYKVATVIRTATGKATATVTVPKPYLGFDYVAAAGDSGTFALAAQRPIVPPDNRPEAFYRLSVSPAGHARLTRLSLPVTDYPGDMTGIALSPDGGQLAVASNGIPPTTQGSFLQVVNLANGTSRQWTWPDNGSEWDWAASQAQFAFTSEHTVVFLMPVGYRPPGWPELQTAVIQLRVLDTTAPGTDLEHSTRAPGKECACGGSASLVVAPAASLVMTFDRAGTVPAPKGIEEVSTATGKTVRVLRAGNPVRAFWSNATGTEVAALTEDAAGHFQPGTITAKGTFTPLPAPQGVTQADWRFLYTAW